MTAEYNIGSGDDEIDLRSVAQRAWRFRWIVAAATCLVPIIVLLTIWNMADTYESTVTVVITSHALDETMSEAIQQVLGPLSVEAYQESARSEAVLTVLRRKLQGMGLPLTSTNGLAGPTDARDTAVPSIGLTVAAADPANAQAIANAWAAAFMEVDLISGGERKQKGFDAIISAHAKALSDVSRLEDELRVVEDRQLVARTQAEFSVNEGQKAAELTSKLQRTLAIEDEMAKTTASLEETKGRIAQLELERKDAPESRPLAERVSFERSSLRGLLARDAVLQAQLRDGRADVTRLRREVSDARLTLARLSTAQVREITPLNRAVAAARLTYERFRDGYSDLTKAKELPRSYLKMGAPAPLPQAPVPRTYTRALLALPFSLLVSLACALFAGVVLESQNRRVHRLPAGRE